VKPKGKVLPPNVEEEIILRPLRQTLFAKQGSAPVRNSKHSSVQHVERASERISTRARGEGKLTEDQLPPRVSQSISPSLARIPLEPPAPSLLEDFIPRRVGQVT